MSFLKMQSLLFSKNNNMEASRKKIYYILIAFILFFVTSDLAFDLLFKFDKHTLFASACSIISAVLVFIGYFKLKKEKVESEVENSMAFIKGNLDKYQLIFSVLDVICSLIAVFSGLIFLGVIFKIFRIGKVAMTPIRIVVIANKFKTVSRPLILGSFVWLWCRIKEKKMTKKLSKTQICSIIASALGIIFGVVSYFVPQIQIAGEAIINIVIGSGVTAVSGFVGTFKDYADKTEAEVEKAKKIAEKKKEIAEKKAEIKQIKHPVVKVEDKVEATNVEPTVQP